MIPCFLHRCLEWYRRGRDKGRPATGAIRRLRRGSLSDSPPPWDINQPPLAQPLALLLRYNMDLFGAGSCNGINLRCVSAVPGALSARVLPIDFSAGLAQPLRSSFFFIMPVIEWVLMGAPGPFL